MTLPSLTDEEQDALRELLARCVLQDHFAVAIGAGTYVDPTAKPTTLDEGG
jgi:hypothetical protein